MRPIHLLPLLLLACDPQEDADPSRPAPVAPTADTAATGDTGSSTDTDTGTATDCTFLEGEKKSAYYSVPVSVDDASVEELCRDVERLCVLGDLQVALVTDLQDLSCLVSVEGDLRILSTDAQNLAGLENLQSVGDELLIDGNRELRTLEGLGDLGIGRRLTLTANRRLVSLHGLESTSVPELTIERNQRLASLEGFTGRHLDYLFIKLNPALTDVSGLNSLTSLDWGVFDWLEGLTSLEGLEGLRDVGYLDLRLFQSSVTSLEPLGPLTDEGSLGTLRLTCSPQLTSLAGLEGLRTLESLDLSGCLAVESLVPLSQLETITDGDLTLSSLPMVTSLEGLGALTSVTGRFHVMGMEGLTDLQGLDSLTTVTSTLNIWRNPQLVSLAGLEALRSVGDEGIDPKYTYDWHGIILDGNPVLEDLSGLHGLEALHSGAKIVANPALTQAEIDELLAAIDDVNGQVQAYDNGN